MFSMASGLALPFVLVFHLTLTSLVTADLDPRPLTWSSKAYGPDGPWQAVRVQFGTPGQPIDAYPGGVWESLLVAPEICSHPESGSTCFAEQAGVYNPNKSSTAYPLPYADIVNETFFGTQVLTGDGNYYFDTLTIIGTDLIPDFAIPSLATFVVTRAYRTLPNGTTYSAALGNIALGAQGSNMTFSTGAGTLNGSLLTGYLADHNVVPSSSFGLHIGSASLRIPGSLWVGGYDQNRIVGPVSSQSYSQNGFPIDLLDISIGVDVGDSPLNVSSVTGLLAQGNSSLVPSLSVEVDPKEPYLYLPESTCHAIAAWLPVTYDSNLGLYLWNTQDPQYQRIVSSPAYLGFTFRLNNAAVKNMTVKVPFKLLNLSLTEPLAHTPTPYFPCSLPTLPDYRLGRSFLQAAFMGVNWMTDNHGVWFLAQAPGPNIGSQPQTMSIGVTDRTLEPSQQTWTDTWQGIWTPISADGEQPTPTGASTSSSGSKADGSHHTPVGLIVGVTIGVVALGAIVLVLFFLLRRRKNRKMEGAAPVGPENTSSLGPQEKFYWSGRPVLQELATEQAATELSGMPGQLLTRPVDIQRKFAPHRSGQFAMSPVELDAESGPRGFAGDGRATQHSPP